MSQSQENTRILMIDDDLKLCPLIGDVFTSSSGHKALSVTGSRWQSLERSKWQVESRQLFTGATATDLRNLAI